MSEQRDPIARLVRDHFEREVEAERHHPASAGETPESGALNARVADRVSPHGTADQHRGQVTGRRIALAAAAALLVILPALMPVTTSTMRPLAARIDSAWRAQGQEQLLSILEQIQAGAPLNPIKQEADQ